MMSLERPLAGLSVNLSISPSEDSASRGFPDWQINRITLQIVSALYGQGAGLVFGHDWRSGGIMETVLGFALAVQSPESHLKANGTDGSPLLRNFVPWPDLPRISDEDRERLASTLQVESAGLPAELHRFSEFDKSEPDNFRYRYLRARGLTHLRRLLNDACDARVCLGGRRFGSSGRYPGIVEEALLGVEAQKPLFLSAVLGGSAQDVVDAVEGNVMPRYFCAPGPEPDSSLAQAYKSLSIKLRAVNVSAREGDTAIDPAGVWQTLAACGAPGLAEHNGLTVEQNKELFHARSLDRTIDLILVGLSSLRRQR